MPKKKPAFAIAIEKLARMVKRGFDEAVSKEEFRELTQLLDGKFKTVSFSLDRLERDVLDIQVTVRPLARLVPEHEERLHRVEKKVGLVK